MMIGAIKEAITFANSQSKHVSVHIVVYKHDGVILKLSKRLHERPNLMQQLKNKMQAGADRAARKLGLSCAPRIEVEFI